MRHSLFPTAMLVFVLTLATSSLCQSQQESASSPALKSAQEAFRAGSAALEANNLKIAHAQFARSVRLAPGVGAGHTALGTVLLAEGDARSAAKELELARSINPLDIQATINLARAYFQTGNFLRSVSTFRLVSATKPGDPPTMTSDEVITFAAALSSAGDPGAARTQIEAALSTTPDSPQLHDALGTLFARQQSYPEAAAEFQRAISLQDRFPLAHFHLGSLYLAQNRPEEAIFQLSWASRLDKNPTFDVQLGRALTAKGQDAEAIALLRRVVEQDSSSVDAKYALALAVQGSGDPAGALPLFAAVVASSPSNTEALVNYALALVQTGDAKSAVPLYLRAADAGQDSPILREDLGVAYLQMSDLNHALQEFQRGLAMDPGNSHLHYDLGLGFKLKDDTNSAIAEFQKAERIDPNLPDPPYTLGVLYMQTGQFAQAQAELEKAVALRDTNGEAWSLLGNVYRQSDQPEKARRALSRAAALLPDQPSPHISLATILAQQGDSAGAAAERKKAAELSRAAYSRQRATFALQSGRELLKRGQAAEATVQLQTAIDADPQSPEAHRLLADALSQQHRPADAALERRRAEELANLSPHSGQPVGDRP